MFNQREAYPEFTRTLIIPAIPIWRPDPWDLLGTELWIFIVLSLFFQFNSGTPDPITISFGYFINDIFYLSSSLLKNYPYTRCLTNLYITVFFFTVHAPNYILFLIAHAIANNIWLPEYSAEVVLAYSWKRIVLRYIVIKTFSL